MSAEMIGKLLAKAERTDNAHEAEAYTKKAEALMVKLGIDEAVARRAAGADVRPDAVIERRVDLYVYTAATTFYPDSTMTAWPCAVCDEDLPIRKFPTTKNPGERGSTCRKCRDARIGSGRGDSNAYNREHVTGWHLVVKALGGDTYTTTAYDAIWLVGFEADVDRMTLLCQSLRAQVMAAMWTWWNAQRDVYGWTEAEGIRGRRNFIVTFYATVARRLEARTKATVVATPGAALALRDKAAEIRDHVAAKDLRENKRGRSYQGSAAGRAAGERANLGENAVGGGHRAIE